MVHHILDAEDFRLVLEPEIFEEDIQCPSNTILHVRVESGGFSACADMDVDVKELARFALDLRGLYETLSGTARIEEPYGMRMYIALTGIGLGHIAVKGFVRNWAQTGCNELTFENEFDQTFLKDFARELLEAYGKYLPETR